MNEFDTKYEIRIAREQDIDKVMKFIRDNWSSNHIFGNDKQFFEYEHVTRKGQLNFILAIDIQTKILEGISGFLYASSDKDNLDVWSVMWMIRENVGNMPFLGTELIKRTKELLNCRSVLGVGDNPKTAVPILHLMLKYHSGKMNHYYRLNPSIEQYRIAVIKEKKILENASKSTNELYELKEYEEVKSIYDFSKYKEEIPYKDEWYVLHRYFEHPIYKYRIFACTKKNEAEKALLIAREVFVGQAKVLRIVDYIGNEKLIAGLYEGLGVLLQEGFEYIDFYCYGFEKSNINMAGFVERSDSDKNIIPNYFEPFVQENVEIYVDSPFEKTKFCKADGDQDRPNRR